MRIRTTLLMALAGLFATLCHGEVKTVTGPAGKLSVDDGGKGGLPVVLIHGNGARKEQWKAQLDHLRKTRRAVAIDLRGHGASEAPAKDDFSVDAVQSDIEAVVQALELKRFVLIGHSYGGGIVGAYAAQHPDQVAGVLFADSAGDVKNTTTPEQRQSLIGHLQSDQFETVVDAWFSPILEAASEEVKKQVMDSVRATPKRVFIGCIASIGEFDTAAAVRAYPGPKLAIVAEAFQDVPTALHKAVPELKIQVMSGVSHWLMMDKPEQFNGLMDQFLADLK